ncbi:MAG: hypothetical protein WBZ37_27825 [Mycobacterium sp.]
MLRWATADENADYPFERYRALSGQHEFRIFYGPEAATQALPWILVVRKVGEKGEYTPVHRGTHHTAYDAKLAAELREKDPLPQ